MSPHPLHLLTMIGIEACILRPIEEGGIQATISNHQCGLRGRHKTRLFFL